VDFDEFYHDSYTTTQFISNEQKDLLDRFCKDLDYDPPENFAYRLLTLEHTPTESGKRQAATASRTDRTKGRCEESGRWVFLRAIHYPPISGA